MQLSRPVSKSIIPNADGQPDQASGSRSASLTTPATQKPTELDLENRLSNLSLENAASPAHDAVVMPISSHSGKKSADRKASLASAQENVATPSSSLQSEWPALKALNSKSQAARGPQKLHPSKLTKQLGAADSSAAFSPMFSEALPSQRRLDLNNTSYGLGDRDGAKESLASHEQSKPSFKQPAAAAQPAAQLNPWRTINNTSENPSGSSQINQDQKTTHKGLKDKQSEAVRFNSACEIYVGRDEVLDQSYMQKANASLRSLRHTEPGHSSPQNSPKPTALQSTKAHLVRPRPNRVHTSPTSGQTAILILLPLLHG